METGSKNVASGELATPTIHGCQVSNYTTVNELKDSPRRPRVPEVYMGGGSVQASLFCFLCRAPLWDCFQVRFGSGRGYNGGSSEGCQGFR